MRDKTRDTVCSLLFLSFGIFIFFHSLEIVPKMEKDLGSGYMPKIIAGSIVALSILKLILTLSKKINEKEKTENSDTLGGLLTIILLAVYALCFNIIGFILSTVIYLFFQILILSDEKNRKIPLFIIIAVVVPVVIYILFVHIIKSPLPMGILGF